jgi:hypothetical protein
MPEPTAKSKDNEMICCCQGSGTTATASCAGGTCADMSRTIACQNNAQCLVTQKLSAELNSLKDGDPDAYESLPWEITGACPATPGAHISSCHDTCSCVDINLTKGNNVASDVLDLAKEIKKSGAFGTFQYECTNSDDCCSTTYKRLTDNGFNCSDKKTATAAGKEFLASGNHFHINQ